VIIYAQKPYTGLMTAIQRVGGKVNHQYQYIDAIAADIPGVAMPDLINIVGDSAISKDSVVAVPRSVTSIRNVVPLIMDSDIYTTVLVGAGSRIFPLSASAALPSDDSYRPNYANLKIRDLHALGYTGRDVVVAVLDTGVRPGYFSLDSDGSIIGGEDFVGDGLPFNSPMNDPHGTFVSALISGNARFSVPFGTFKTSMDHNFPGAIE